MTDDKFIDELKSLIGGVVGERLHVFKAQIDELIDERLSDLELNDSEPAPVPVKSKTWGDIIEREAFNQIGTNEYRNKITHDGKLACAAFVSGVLLDCGAMHGRGEVGQLRLEKSLRAQGFVEVKKTDIKPGDIIFWNRYPSGKHGHVGVIVSRKDSNKLAELTVIDNSSTNRVPVYRTNWPHKTRPIRCYLRKEGKVNG